MKNSKINEKIVKKSLVINTLYIDVFKYDFCNVNKYKCLVACKNGGGCHELCDGKTSDKLATVTQCRAECITRNKLKNMAYLLDSANFSMDIPETIINVVSMKMTHIILPPVIYNISAALGNNYFSIYDGETAPGNKIRTVEVPPGNYTIDELTKVITLSCGNITGAAPNISLVFHYDPIIDKVYILKYKYLILSGTDDLKEKNIGIATQPSLKRSHFATT